MARKATMKAAAKPVKAGGMIAFVLAAALLAGCASAHVGVGIPIPGPIKPHVGVSVDKRGIRGTGGASAKVGPVPVSVGGTTKPIGGMKPKPAKQKAAKPKVAEKNSKRCVYGTKKGSE